MTVSNFTLRGPLSAVAGGPGGALRGRPGGPRLQLRAVAARRPEAAAPRRPSGGPVPHPHPVEDAHRRVRGARALRRQRAVWPLAVAGLPPRSARGRGAPARGAAGAHLAGPEPGGRRRRRLPRPAAVLRSVRRGPAVRGGALPRRFDAEVSPLLRWLDRERLPYDLTTDLALARHEGPALGNAPGVAFAGSELWLPDELAQAAARLRRRRRPAGLVRAPNRSGARSP